MKKFLKKYVKWRWGRNPDWRAVMANYVYIYIHIGLPFIFRDLETLVLQTANWQFYRKAWHFWGYMYSERFDIQALFVLFTVTWKIHFAQKMELNRVNIFVRLFFITFNVD